MSATNRGLDRQRYVCLKFLFGESWFDRGVSVSVVICRGVASDGVVARCVWR